MLHTILKSHIALRGDLAYICRFHSFGFTIMLQDAVQICILCWVQFSHTVVSVILESVQLGLLMGSVLCCVSCIRWFVILCP